MKLDTWELETIFGLLRDDIINHTVIAKLDRIEGKIDQSRLDWHLGHAEELKKMEEKLKKILIPKDPAAIEKLVNNYSEDMSGPNMTAAQKESLVNLILTLTQ